jgi:hypothetical protein
VAIRDKLWEGMATAKKDRCTLPELEKGLKIMISKGFGDCKPQIRKAYLFTKN